MKEIEFCKKCSNQKFESKRGIVCGLTNEKPDFDESCPDFVGDLKEVQKKQSLLKPNEKRAYFAQMLISIVVGLDLIMLVSNYFQFELLRDVQQGVTITPEQANANDLRQSIISVAFILAYIVSAVTFIRWFRRAYYNLDKRLDKGTEHGESNAAGAWFIPFVNLVRPYRIMKELWERSSELLKEKTNHRVEIPLIGLWWGFWLFSGFYENITLRLFDSYMIQDLIDGTLASMLGTLFSLPCGLLIIQIIRKFNTLETQLVFQEKS